jgi:8-oxo-dGTP pyrophosphatase MutT (NUDIX family)
MLVDSKILQQCKRNRAGVIPYVCFDEKLYFILAQDRRTLDLCDFGGGCKKDENALQTAIREFKEESNGIFKEYYNEEKFDNTYALMNKKMTIIFLPISKEWLEIARRRFLISFNPEVIDITCIDETTFRNIIYKSEFDTRKRVWIRIQNFFINLITPANLCLILKRSYIYSD